jgi:hypothetical protein
MLNLSKEDRKKIVKNHSEDTLVHIGYNSFRFKAIDKKFGYMIGSFDGIVYLKIWELSNGNKLIAVQKLGNMCYNVLDFYRYNGKVYHHLNNKDILPAENMERNFFDDNYEENIKKISAEIFLYPCEYVSISHDRLNIFVEYYITGDRTKDKEYGLIADRMELIWNDGKFTKGKVYWREKE